MLLLLLQQQQLLLLQLGVGLQVGSEVGAVSERSAALRAGERTFSGVCSEMTLQQPRPREGLAAQLTAARQRVCPDVHLESAERRVQLAAVTTRQLPVCRHDTSRPTGSTGGR